MRQFLFAILIALPVMLFAQQKQGKAMAPYDRKSGKAVVAGRAIMTAYYAMNAKDIKNSGTYIDFQKLEVGKNIVKYCSQWIFNVENKRDAWNTNHPHVTNVPHFLSGFNKCDYWDGIQYSDIFIQNGVMTVYTTMPLWAWSENSYYQEKYPLMQWSFVNEKKSILGYTCQKATCIFRGRTYIAWFTPQIPARYGPWKFGGLPGLILKVCDTKGLYSFECVKITKNEGNIMRRPFKGYRKRDRKTVLKLEQKYNVNWQKAVGAGAAVDNRGNIIQNKNIHFDPIELE